MMRRLAAILGLVILICPALARADEPEPRVGVSITAVSPTSIDADSTLTLSGEITNESDVALNDVDVALWRDATVINSLFMLRHTLDSESLAGASIEPPGATFENLAPHETKSFTLRARVSGGDGEPLYLSIPRAAYAVGATVRVAGELAAESHTFVTYPDDVNAEIANVVVLSRRPSYLPMESATTPVFVDDSLSEALGGELDRMLAFAEKSDTQVVIDPMLFDEVTALASGPHLVVSDASTAPGDSAAAARASAWLERLSALASDGRVARTLYGMPDVTTALASGAWDAVQDSAAMVPDELAHLPLAIVPADGILDKVTLDALVDLGPRWVFVDNVASDALVTSYRGMTLVTTSFTLTRGVDDNATPAERRGRAQAEQLTAAISGTIAVGVARDGVELDALDNTPVWATPRLLTTLVGEATPSEFVFSETPEIQADTALAEQVANARHAGAVWAAMTGTDELDQSWVTPWSLTFNRDQAAQQDWTRMLNRVALNAVEGDAIRVQVTNWITTAEDNQLPATIVNDTPRAITVRVVFESDNELRADVDDSELVTIDPNESSTVRVSPRTKGNGKVGITAHVVTQHGDTVGTPSSFVLTGTNTGKLGWIIIVVSGVVLIAASAIRIKAVRKGAKRD